MKFREKYSSDRHRKSESLPKPIPKDPVKIESVQNLLSAVIIKEPPPKPPIEQIYNPYPLLPKSSFNPSSISEKRLAHLHPIIKAKYAAYSRPNADVEYEINKSELRSKAYLAEKMTQDIAEKKELQKKFDILHRNQDPASIALGISLRC